MHVFQTPSEVNQWLKRRVTGTLCSDSRQIQPGDAFMAWPGTVVDARKFVGDAVRRGAVACLVESEGVSAFALEGETLGSLAGLQNSMGAIAAEFFGAPSQDLAVVAVTGTNGKTSTAWWLAQALSVLPAEQALPSAMIGTLGIGRPPIGADLPGEAALAPILSTGMTTPDPVLLQRMLRRFVDDGLRACVVEASSIGIEEHRLAGTQLRVAVFTNFTQDHLDYHGTMGAYWESKRKLFAWPGLQCAVVNVDDEHGAQLAQALAATELDVWTTSCGGAARLQACAMGYGTQGLRFEVVEADDVHVLQTRTIGAYNVSNLLGVIAAMRGLGVPLQAAVEACGALNPVPGRMECLGGIGQPLVAVDYAHTPDALAQAISALRPLAAQREGRLWCVFGCGGDRDPSKRPLMGAIAAQRADQVVVTSDNPRSEKPEAIISQILLGMPKDKTVQVQVDRAVAIADVLARAADNDVILLAGKGHEAVQDVAGTKHVFSDKDHASRALLQRATQNGERLCIR